MKNKLEKIRQSLIDNKDIILKTFNHELIQNEFESSIFDLEAYGWESKHIIGSTQPVGNIYLAASSYMPILFPISIIAPALISGNKITIKPSHRYPGSSSVYKQIFSDIEIEEIFDEQTSHHKLNSACSNPKYDKIIMAGTNKNLNSKHKICMEHKKQFLGFVENKNISIVSLEKEHKDNDKIINELSSFIAKTSGVSNACPEIILVDQDHYEFTMNAIIKYFNSCNPKSFFRKRHLTLLDDINNLGGKITSTNIGINIASDITHEMKICAQESGGRIISIIPYCESEEVENFINYSPNCQKVTTYKTKELNVKCKKDIHCMNGNAYPWIWSPNFRYSSHFGKWGGDYSIMECTNPYLY